jgi:PfaD family protein
LGNPIFQKRHRCRASFFAGSMYRGIASERMVAAMARAGLMSFFGSAGFGPEELEPRIQSIQGQLSGNGANLPYGMCLISDLRDPEKEMAHVDLFIKYGVPAIEASAFLSMTPALVYCRLHGIREEGGRIISPRRIVAKCSRLEVVRRFCSPAPENVVRELAAAGRITEEEARLSQRVPMASDIAVEADSGGHTDQGVAFCLLPAFVALKDTLSREYAYEEPILVGCGGGIGTPEAVAAAFAMGADFVFTGSINQCTVESGAHDAVKELLSTLNIHDTGIAPAADMFEIGARVQVVRKKTRFPERANRLYQLFQRYQSIEEIPEAVREDIEKSIFKRSFSEVWDRVCAYKRRTHPEQIQAALENPRLHMKLIFQWYMVHSNQMALTGEVSETDNFQIHCGPAMGAFNQWAQGTRLEDWRNRGIVEISDLLLRKACEHIETKSLQTRPPQTNQPTAPASAAPANGQQTPPQDREIKRQDIAVIGMAGRFPMAPNLSAFWDNLAAGRNCISEVSEDRWPLDFFDPRPEAPGKSYSKWMGMLEDVDKFDPLFFSISPVDAEAMDPQQRLFLESCWSCIEDAGYDPTRLGGSRCGVFAGCGAGDYGLGFGGAEVDASTLMGASMSILAARISYALNLQGPSLAIDTACSSSLVAIASACDSLILGTSDLALAGGVNVMAGPTMHIVTSKAGMLSPDGRCFAFDQRANGFVPGEGVGVVLLKRLADAERDGDRIDAVIRGWGVNQDGKTNGITAPSGDSQTRLEKYVYDRFGLNPDTIQMIEAHGTGTKLGDPVEVGGLKASFADFTRRKQYCALGSVKSNVGHLLAAAGVAGFIKSTLALKQRKIPPTIHFETLNEHIELEDSPFYVNTICREWRVEAGEIRRAAVSGFGFSGTNAHIVLEEYRSSSRIDANHEPTSAVIVPLSAKNEERLREMAANLLRYLDGPFEGSGYSLHDLADTLQTGRAAMPERLAFAARSIAETKRLLESWLAGKDLEGVSRGRVQRDKTSGFRPAAGDGVKELIQRSISQRDFAKLTELWVNGVEIDWRRLDGKDAEKGPGKGSGKRRRLSLPTYPFARERYWREAKRVISAGNEVRPDQAGTAGEPAVTLLCRPAWKASPASADGDGRDPFARHVILLAGRFASQAAWIESKLPGARCVALRSAAAGAGKSFEAASCQAFETIRALLLESTPGKTLVQALVDSSGEGQLMSGLSGLLKTAALENPAILGQVIESDAKGDPAAKLIENRLRLRDPRVRYVDGERSVLVFEELAVSFDKPSHCWRDGGVYLITGAGGGLGFLFAREIAAKIASARLILTGRSALDERRQARLESLRSTGAHVEYHKVDVTDEAAVVRLMSGIHRDFGRLDGVLHSAGMNRDNFLTRKPADEFKAVLAPKVKGTVLLERACRELAPEWIALFSSASGVTGNLGQADYAAANGFMDAFAHWHNQSAGRMPTRVVSIDWPLWKDGGMHVDDATLATMRERAGAAPMSAAAGFDAFYRTMANEACQVMVLSGEEKRLRQGLSPANMPRPVDAPLAPLAAVNEQELRDRVLDQVKSLLGETLKLAKERMNEFEPLESYGIDSILVTQLNLKLGRVFPEISQTLLFEVRNLRQLAERLIQMFEAECIRWTGLGTAKTLAAAATSSPAAVSVLRTRPHRRFLSEGSHSEGHPQTSPVEKTPDADCSDRALDIAIIGLSGRYPMAPDVNVFWANLRDGRDCITEVPPERWNWRDYYSDPNGPFRGHSSKWGGFIDDVDKFDPQFFSISPKVARYLDPQERLMMEETWKAIEDAGYRPQDLRPKDRDEAAPDVGVYIGSTYTEYQLFGAEAAMAGRLEAYAGNLASIANRVSYLLDLHGPSVAVDTMCSSSLTCLHLACQDLKAGRTRMAIVGSVNLSIHPNKYRVLSGGQFLSSHGRCKSFGEGGDGYIPSEGVGAVLLKPLADARRDGDQIYGVIKGSAINHSGRTNGYSVPNPDAQKRVVMQALDEAGVDPVEVSYVEAHGTGTKLGDPIEIAGLTKAFGPRPGGERCWIGSAKSNIGHCEAAAGLAGLTKILLQMKHRQIAPSIHSRVLNPRIDFASGPFEVNQELREWRPSPVGGRRVAGISSFGAGGSNAHLVIEEYTTPLDVNGQPAFEPAATRRPQLSSALIALSARNESQLREVARNLFQYLEDPARISGIAIQDIAYTLQAGRKPMEERLGFLAASIGDLRDQLARFLGSDSTPRGHIRGRVEEFSENAGRSAADSDLSETINGLASQGAATAILQLWVSGYEFDWRGLYGAPLPRRISLPAYPFARQRYWVESLDSVPAANVARKASSEPLAPPATRPADEMAVERPGPISLPKLSQPALSLSTPSAHALSATPDPGATPPAARALPGIQPAPSVSLASLEESLLATLAKTLCMEPEEIRPNTPFINMGLDSVVGVEWVQQINQRWGLDITAASVYDHPTLRQFSAHIYERISIHEQNHVYEQSNVPPPALLTTQPGAVIGSLVDLQGAAPIQKPGSIQLSRLSANSLSSAPEPAVASLRTATAAPELVLSQESIEEELLASLAKTLCMEPDEIRANTPFTNMGLDSVVGVEWVQQINQRWKLEITAASVYDHPTLRQFTTFVQQQMESRSPRPEAPGKSSVAGEPPVEPRHESAREKPTRIELPSLSANPSSVAPDFPPDIQRQAVVLGKPVMAARPSAPAHVPAVSREALEESLLASLAKTLCMEPEEIRPNTPFVNMGLDSVVGVEWVQQINQKWGLDITAASVYDQPTLRQFAEFIYEQIQNRVPPPPTPPRPMSPVPREAPQAEDPQTKAQAASPVVDPSANGRPDVIPAGGLQPIAVIGMSGRFPGAADVGAFWTLLENGQQVFSPLPNNRDWDLDGPTMKPDRTYVRRGAFLDEIDCFDPLFFQMSPKEAATLDPCERIFVEESWKAIEDAGLDPTRISGRRWGVFCGNGGDYSLHLLKILGYSPRVTLSQVPTRVSHCLNLSGPSVSLDIGCASALLAIAEACDQISAGKCEAAIAGGALIHSTPNTLTAACQLELLSKQDAGCALDEQSDGMMPGEAVGAIILKPLAAALADGDRIHCVIEGWGSNHNGRTHGIVAPSADAQAKLFAEVYEHYGIDPDTVTFVEANASGMPLADRAEIEALTRVFSGDGRRQACVLGTVENNIGHAFHASGVSHFIKTALALKHRRIPATRNVHRRDGLLNEEHAHFVINAETIPWSVAPGEVRRAAINSFGATGSNVHLVVSEAPALESNREPVRTGLVLIALSARTTDGLKRRCRELASWLQSPASGWNANLRALSANLLLRRTHLGQRCAFVASDPASLCERLFRIGEGEVMETVFQGSVEPEDKLSPALDSLAASKVRELAGAAQSREEDLLILADLYVKGVSPDMSACFTSEEKAVLTLPGYPFEKRSCWISAGETAATAATPTAAAEIIRRLTEFVCELTGLAPAEIQKHRSLKIYGVDSLIGMRLLNRINAQWGLNCDASVLLKDTLEEIAKAIPNAPVENLSSGNTGASGAGETLPEIPGPAWRRPAFIGRLDFDVPPEEEGTGIHEGPNSNEGEAQLERLLRHGLGLWTAGGRLCFEFFRGTHTRESIGALLNHPGSLRSVLETGVRYYPATYMQRLALKISEVDKVAAFNIGQVFWIDAPVDIKLLNRALSELTEHHSILRTGARRVGDDWAQAVYPSVDIQCREVEWPQLDGRTQFVEALNAYQNERQNLLFDIQRLPMFEVCLLHNGRDLAAIHFYTHHFHADGFTLFLFLQELHQRYRALLENRSWKPPATGAEYAHLALSQFDPADRGNNRFWQDLLARQVEGPVLQDRAGYADSETRTTGAVTLDTAVEFAEGARRSGATLTQLVACATGILMYRLTGRNMAVQLVFNLRDRYEFESVLGDFSSSAPLILGIEPAMTLGEVSELYNRAATDVQIHKRFDFLEFIRLLSASKKWSGISIDSNDRDALCQVTDFAERLLDIPLEGRETVASVVVCLMKTGGRLALELSYDRSLLSRRTMELFGEAMKELLVRMTSDPEMRVLDFHPPSELRERLAC